MPLSIFWKNRQLVWQMARREIVGRYRGSIMGLLWSFFNPLLMLLVYTFVFSVVFEAKWGQSLSAGKTEFAMVLFAGLIVFNFFAEVITRAPTLIVDHVNFVKRVVFPLEVLPLIALAAAFFHALVSFTVLLLFNLLINQTFHVTAFLFPLVLLPLALLIVGCAWVLASLGVYLRDVAQVVSIATMGLLFASPIFFPLAAVPEEFRRVMLLNPLTFIIEQSRQVLIWGGLPDWVGLAIFCLPAITCAWLGFVWFQKTRKGFADVL